MNRFTLRLSPDLARRFDAVAATRGGRSRLLRRLVEAAAQAPLPEPVSRPKAASSSKLTLRLPVDDLAAIEREAAAMGLSRTQWTVALVQRRLWGRAQLSRPEALAFIEVQRDLRRIGVNVNQIARALNTAVLEGAVLALETAQLDAFAIEIRAHISGLRRAFEGNLDYWADRP